MGLRRIYLRDFVIVRELELDADSGFTVLTGETGAGKSILIDALQWALGARADTGMIREGADRAEVSAEFDGLGSLQTWLQEGGFEHADGLLVRRSVDRHGRSRSWINGTPCTVAQLRDLSESLVDIHGQHAWQSLTRPESVRGLLDRYAGVSDATVMQAWREWRTAAAELEAAKAGQQTREAERDRLMWHLADIEKLNPLPGEWEELNAQHSRLAHAQALLDAAETALSAIQSDEGGALTHLTRAQSALHGHVHLEPLFGEWGRMLDASLATLEDLAHDLGAYLRRTEPDPLLLSTLDDRLSAWIALARRLRRAPSDLPSQRAQWKSELERLDAQSDLASLLSEVERTASRYQSDAEALSRQRRRAALALAHAVTQAMQDLGMAGGRFEVSVETCPPAAHGIDEIHFRVAGHAGSTPRAVGKVASGGELSRIALAIAVCTSELGTAGTLIFDEVDSGVGGAVAKTVGRLMKQLGRHRQVLCVTHLPQVAACADSHWVVRKAEREHGVQTEVRAVTGEHRVREIARMLGGERLSAASLAHAQDMLTAAPGRPSP